MVHQTCYNIGVKRKKDNKMTREEMMLNIITELGHENPTTIWFCNIADSNTADSVVEVAYTLALANG